MSLQRIPWAVNGPDVPHSATLARQANFQHGADQTGIVGPDSLVVSEGAIPGPFVTVGPGSGTITYAQGRANAQDRAYASAKDQGVGVRNDALTEVPINPTTSAGRRFDAVVVEINDPEFEGTSGSVDYSTHEFVRFRVLQGVDAALMHPWQLSNLRRPTLLLALIDIPPSTGTITDDMITDLRQMSIERSKVVPLNSIHAQDENIIIPHSQQAWATYAAFDNISVPDWATRVLVDMDFGPLYARDGRANGLIRVLLTGNNDSLATVAPEFVEDSGVWTRFQTMTGGSFAVHRLTSGGTLRAEVQIRRWGNPDGDIIVRRTVAKGSLTFEEAATFTRNSGV